MTPSEEREAERDYILFAGWVQMGVDKGWISEPVCATHDGIPSTPEEEAEWEAGFDPCEVVVRVWDRDR